MARAGPRRTEARRERSERLGTRTVTAGNREPCEPRIEAVRGMSGRPQGVSESAGEGVATPCCQRRQDTRHHLPSLLRLVQRRVQFEAARAVTDHTRSSPVYGPTPSRRRGGFGGGVRRREVGCPPGLEPDGGYRCPAEISLPLEQPRWDRTATGGGEAGVGTGDDREQDRIATARTGGEWRVLVVARLAVGTHGP